MSLGPLHKPTRGEGYFTDPKGLMQWAKRHEERGNSPQETSDKCFSKHANLRAVFSGDQSRTQSAYAAKQGDWGNIVHYFMSDYGANGLRVYRFFPIQIAWTRSHTTPYPARCATARRSPPIVAATSSAFISP